MKKSVKSYIMIDDKFYFIKNKNMSKKKFLKIFKVKRKKYFYKLYSRLYDFLVGGEINLYYEYKKYYKKEYLTFKEFLVEHHNIPNNLISKFNNKKSYYKYKNFGNEQPLYDLLHDDEIKKIIIEFTGGFIYED